MKNIFKLFIIIIISLFLFNYLFSQRPIYPDDKKYYTNVLVSHMYQNFIKSRNIYGEELDKINNFSRIINQDIYTKFQLLIRKSNKQIKDKLFPNNITPDNEQYLKDNQFNIRCSYLIRKDGKCKDIFIIHYKTGISKLINYSGKNGTFYILKDENVVLMKDIDACLSFIDSHVDKYFITKLDLLIKHNKSK